ncbi:1-acyl-sn-glycerol-3-phosphate acyltransferase [Salibacteraceae bacterium]|nr:1-acyl-sn-glycerol-3-phosphate acyltransferase [Salibacteraceae bacterium]
MNLVLQPFRVLWKVWFLLHFVGTMIILYPLFYFLLSSKKRFKFTFNLMRVWSLQLLSICGVIMKVDQRSELPAGPFIICPNHGSYLDIITMYRVFKRYFIFMGKAEILEWPLFGIFFSKGMNISVNRQSNRGSHEALKKAESELRNGHNIVIFPEGTIPPTAPKMRSFKNGAFKLSLEQNIPIVPVTFVNNWRRLQAGAALRVLGGPGYSNVIIHPSVYPKDYENTDVVKMKKDIFEIIEKPLRDGKGY